MPAPACRRRPCAPAAGLPTEAVLIFNNMLRKLAKTFAPHYMAAIFESLGKTHRDEVFAEYKANRSETPPDLITQIPYIERLLAALRIPVIQYPGFEADDVIGTLSRKAADAGCEVVIVSSDKDMLQLVTDRVSMLNPAKDDTWYDPAKVKEFMGVEPRQVADLLALKGDAVDNIPGAPGIGEKGAKDLIDTIRLRCRRARPRRRSDETHVPREPAEQSRAHPDEPAARDHPLRRPDSLRSRALRVQRARCRRPQSLI